MSKNQAVRQTPYTPSEDIEIAAISLNTDFVNHEFNNEIIKVYVNEGTGEDTDYEPYGAMPSPEFQSPIRNYGDNVNILNYSNLIKNDINNLSVNEEGYIYDESPTADSRAWNYDSSDWREELEADTYTLTLNFINIPTHSASQIMIFDSNGGRLGLEILTNKEKSELQFTLTEKQTIGIELKVFDGKCRIKLEKGTKATQWSPYGCGSVNLKVCNKNILYMEYRSQNGFTYDGNTITVKDIVNTSYLYNMKASIINNYSLRGKNIKFITTWEGKVDKNNSAFLCNIKDLKTEVSRSISVYDVKTTTITKKTEVTKIQLGKDEIITSINLYSPNLEANPNYTANIQCMFEDIEDETFVEHQEQTATFPTKEGQVFHKGDYLADDGVHHVRKTRELTGEEEFGSYKYDQNSDYVAVHTSMNNLKSYSPILCNFLLKNETAISNNEGNAIGSVSSGYLYICLNKSLIGATSENNSAECRDKLKAYIKNQYDNGTPFIVEFTLINEEVEPYNQEQQEAYNQIKKLRSYKGTTHIFSEDEISPVFDVTYKKDLETILNKLSTAEVNE